MASSSGGDFKCVWKHCGKSFRRNSDLRRHAQIHTNVRPYHCQVKDCNKSFIQRSALTVHSRTHTGEKPYLCKHDGCHKVFSDSSSLARHRRIHTGRQPYICQEQTCGRSFCRKTTLTKHHRRFHAQEPVTRTPLEDSNSNLSYLATVIPSPSDQFVFAQQAYPDIATASHGFSSYQSVPMTIVNHQGQTPIVEHNNSQQKCNQSGTGYLQEVYYRYTVSYIPCYQRTQPTRLLNYPGRANWDFPQ